MESYGPIGRVGSERLFREVPGRSERAVPPTSIVRPGDRVEISAQASGGFEPSAGRVRVELVERVQQEIRAGSYESESRLNEAADALFERLRLMF